MNVAAITPLKSQSSRLPGKNFLDLAGKPLCWHALQTVQRLQSDKLTCGTFVYCDRRTSEFLPPGVQWIDEGEPPAQQDGNALFASMASLLPECSHLLFFNCTAPFVKLETYRLAFDIFGSSCDSAVSAVALRGRFWLTGNPQLHDPAKCQPTQNQVPLWMESEAFWLISRDTILRERRRVGHRPRFIEVAGVEAVDINTQADYELAVAIAGAA